MSGFLSKFDTNHLSLSPSDSKKFQRYDTDFMRAGAGVGNPLGYQFLMGKSGLGGTPTEEGQHDRAAVPAITNFSHNYGAETAAIIAASMYGGGMVGEGGEEAGTGATTGGSSFYNNPSGASLMSGMLRGGGKSKKPDQPDRPELIDLPEEQPSAQPVAFNPNPQPNQGPGSDYYNMMLSLSDLGAKERKIKEQSAMAEQLRGTASPEMRSAGRVTQAAHPLEFLNTEVRRGIGEAQKRRAMTQQEQLSYEIRRRIQEERARQQQNGTLGPGQQPNQGYPNDNGFRRTSEEVEA